MLFVSPASAADVGLCPEDRLSIAGRNALEPKKASFHPKGDKRIDSSGAASWEERGCKPSHCEYR
jgi:hypothetical protein